VQDYHYGKQYGVGWTLASVNWTESDGCRYQVGKGDYGCYQQNIKYFLSDYKIKDTHYNRSKYATKLIVNRPWARDVAIKKILSLKVKYGSWDKAIGAYNGTINFKTKKYQQEIYKRMRFLKTIIKD
jgi:hypothetical protein